MKIKKRSVLLCGGSLVQLLDSPTSNQTLAKYLRNRTILVYLFARPVENWQSVMNNLETTQATSALCLEWELASADPTIRRQQLKAVEVVFILGGDETRLMEHVSPEEWGEILERRFIAGSSAGANVFSSYFFSNDHKEIRRGAALLPIKTICHFSSHNSSDAIELGKLAPNDKLLTLKEDQFEILEIP